MIQKSEAPFYLLNGGIFNLMRNDVFARRLTPKEEKFKNKLVSNGYATTEIEILYLHYIRGVPVNYIVYMISRDYVTVAKAIVSNARVAREILLDS